MYMCLLAAFSFTYDVYCYILLAIDFLLFDQFSV